MEWLGLGFTCFYLVFACTSDNHAKPDLGIRSTIRLAFRVFAYVLEIGYLGGLLQVDVGSPDSVAYRYAWETRLVQSCRANAVLVFVDLPRCW